MHGWEPRPSFNYDGPRRGFCSIAILEWKLLPAALNRDVQSHDAVGEHDQLERHFFNELKGSVTNVVVRLST